MLPARFEVSDDREKTRSMTRDTCRSTGSTETPTDATGAGDNPPRGRGIGARRHSPHPKGSRHGRHHSHRHPDPGACRRIADLEPQPILGLRPSGAIGVVVVIVLVMMLTGRV